MENSNNVNRDPYFPDFEEVCIIADKVYAHCQQRECFEEVKVRLPEGAPCEFVDITFNPGEIIAGTLVITPLPDRPNFSRVRFRVRVTFNAKVRNSKTGAIINVPGRLPDIEKDIVLYIPESRDEFNFDIVLETASEKLTSPLESHGFLVFAAGVFMIIKVVGRVQLLIPEFGFCPEPPECEPFLPEDVCDDFDERPFPDFFPQQLGDDNEGNPNLL